MTQLSAKGIIRSLVVGRFTVWTLFIVFNNKYKRIGRITVSIPIEKSFAFIISIGRYRGDFEKKKVVPRRGIKSGWKI